MDDSLVTVALLAGRLLLAGVFGVAALSKLTSRLEFQQVLKNFGVPVKLGRFLAVGLPAAEATIAVALVPVATAWWGALGASALLFLFTAAIAVTLARGRRPACRCFGQLLASPIGWPTLARNGGLWIVSAFVAWQGRFGGGVSAMSAFPEMTTRELVGLSGGAFVLGVLAVNLWFMVQLFHQNGRLLVRMDALEAKTGLRVEAQPKSEGARRVTRAVGLRPGAPAPDFSLADTDGGGRSLDTLRQSGLPILLVFTDANCGPCTALLPEVGEWQRTHAHELTIAVISRGALDTAKYVQHGLKTVLLQRDREVANAYHVVQTPSAVLLKSDGTIGSAVAEGPDAIRALVARAPAYASAEALMKRVRITKGATAPELQLPDLTGQIIDLASFHGNRVLVLFWNPGCRFCRQMLPDLRAWEAHSADGALRLLIVSTGSVDDNQGTELRSPIVLDQTSSARQAFGATGTPMGLLIGVDGTTASDLAAGAPAVMALLTHSSNDWDAVEERAASYAGLS
jgi:peroxiredoxin